MIRQYLRVLPFNIFLYFSFVISLALICSRAFVKQKGNSMSNRKRVPEGFGCLSQSYNSFDDVNEMFLFIHIFCKLQQAFQFLPLMVYNLL